MEKKSFWKGFLLGSTAFIALVLILFFTWNSSNDLSLSDNKVTDLNGKNIDLTSYKGKPIVVNYWATWCKPCVEEFVHFEKLKDKYKDQIHFIMISDESLEKISSFVAKKKYTFNFLKSKDDLNTYGILARPTTFFYDSNGTILNKHTGGLSEEVLNLYLEKQVNTKQLK